MLNWKIKEGECTARVNSERNNGKRNYSEQASYMNVNTCLNSFTAFILEKNRVLCACGADL